MAICCKRKPGNSLLQTLAPPLPKPIWDKTVLLFQGLLLLYFMASCRAYIPQRDAAEQLVRDLGCAGCHSGLALRSSRRDQIPDLSCAGLRYNPAYLFSYLMEPTRIRQHIGYARMPNYHLSRKEALALVLFLDTQRDLTETWPEYPFRLNQAIHSNPGKTSNGDAKALITETLGCTSCHNLEAIGASSASELSTVAYRLNPEWLARYLAAPYVFDRSGSMPAMFYKLDPTKGFVEILPGSAEKIGAIVDYLFSLNKKKSEELQESYQLAKAAYPEANASLGERIFRSQNCVACHRHAFIKPWAEATAPDLSIEGTKVNRHWLEKYLKAPTSIRPFGFYPGSGSRMPDFGLADDEVTILSDYLMKQQRPINTTGQTFTQERLSAFAMAKVAALLKEKLPCLGCHQLGNLGGRIGPNLSSLRIRLKPSYVSQIINNPRAVVPETIMPKIEMPEETSSLLVNFLLQQDIAIDDSSVLSLIDNPITLFEKEGAGTYLTHCAPCHGERGDGAGYNAKFLPTPPTAHSNGAYMAKRPDDTVFDGIFGGGYILNKHHFMPAFGHTLERSEIWNLVSHIRQLCTCAAPKWSRDDS